MLIAYHNLPTYVCGTIGLENKEDYVLETIIKNCSRKKYKLALIFSTRKRANTFRYELFLRLQSTFLFARGNIKACQSYKYIELSDDCIPSIRLVLLSSWDGYILERDLRGLDKDFKIIQMNEIKGIR